MRRTWNGMLAVLCIFGGGILAVTANSADRPSESRERNEGWISLFNGRNLDGWMLRRADGKNTWTVKDGILTNTGTGSDIVSALKMGDHELHVEYRVPQNGNSGVYLQGRYEVQVADSMGQQPNEHMNGAVYGKLKPRVNASKPHTEWQTFHVKFYQPRFDRNGKQIGKSRITLVHNGTTTLENAEWEGVTGAALENQEGMPGGLLLQGDHGPVEYRTLRFRPLRDGRGRDSR